ncbi:SDR family NAD(P)-dependent oxidoreductase [Vibrio profundum]|uniref:SDR family oxidoreductase n=1 Tax=Vibrio profundum TaxID=2910247 RepID=UPI003D09758D
MELGGNTVLITGGARGIGLELAKQFLAKGNKVIITGRDQKNLEKAQDQLNGVVAIQSDVGNPDDIRELYLKIEQDHPDLNILINNAGIMKKVNLQEHQHSPEALTQEIDINVKGPIWMTDMFLPLLKKQKKSAVVNVSSALAFVPLPISPVYCATKSALHSYTLSLREQMRNTQVSVFELAPPATETDILGEFSEDDMEGTTAMTTPDMVAIFMAGFAKDNYEICPGQSNQLRFMGRFFPKFILKQLSKNLAAMHSAMGR